MKKFILMAAFAVACSLTLSSCGAKKADNQNAGADSCCAAKTECVQACEADSTACCQGDSAQCEKACEKVCDKK